MELANYLLEHNICPDWLTRFGIVQLCKQRLAEESTGSIESDLRRKLSRIDKLRKSPVALATEKSNEQHYELPTDFFLLVLGPRRKYSASYFESASSSLASAENAMLRIYCQRADLKDGMSVLDLGCGWGSLTLYIAEYYPKCKIVALSASWTQKQFIEKEAKVKGYKNVRVVTADVNEINIVEGRGAPFDRIFSIEMFEHMKNYESLLEKVSRWLKPDGRVFLHVFVHRNYTYNFESEGDTNWMGKYFFSGGTMMSSDLLLYFQKDLHVLEHWAVDGRHYAQTSELWLQNMDRNIKKIRPILRSTYGVEEAVKWEAYWRTFFMSCAELFGFRNGQEWYVVHYLFGRD